MTSPSYPTDKAQYRPQAAQSPWASEQVYDSPSGPPPSYDAPPSRFYERRESEERKEDVEFTPRNRHSWNAPYEQGYANEPTYLGVQGNSGRYLSPPSHPSCSRSAPSSPAPYMSYPQGYDPNRAPQGYSPNGAPPQDYSYNRAGSPSPSGRPGGLLGGLKSFAPGASPSQLLNPPPPSFNRPPPDNLPYNPFPPCALISVGSHLEDGFPALPPPTTVQPHPFSLHDVKEEDWTKFVGHLKSAAALSPTNRIVSNVAPMVLGVGFLPGLFVTKGIESHMKKRKDGSVAEIINQWNHYFFYPRRMEVTLTQGQYNSGAQAGDGMAYGSGAMGQGYMGRPRT
ncbi:hypothetical protein EW026_g1861 [Hermanssonia centrifuga]|uniref:Uncharacterized protein n=1 Tax=Hermanssonia centrifuga TaxID=98765 RepID=A0A4S4KRV9_9APHY|nr:hypothetical protein EW026_g1861 [Hermanssonia centrifuga]